LVGALGLSLCASTVTVAAIAAPAAPRVAVAPVPADIGPALLVADGYGDGGPASHARFDSPAVAFAALPNGAVAFVDANSVRALTTAGTVVCLAGCSHTAGFSGDGGAATAAKLKSPTGIAAAADGTLFVADTGNNRLRRISPTGTITTVAGNGTLPASFAASGAATTLAVTPSDVAVAPDGKVYFVDDGVRRAVRRLSGTSVTTVLGGASGFHSGWDTGWNGGPATAVTLPPYGRIWLGVAPSGGTLYANVSQDAVVVSVTTVGVLHTVAGFGNIGLGEDTGDGGPATAANLAYPSGLVVEANGAIDIASISGIRQFTVGGTITMLRPGATSGGGLALSSGTFYRSGPLETPSGQRWATILATAPNGTSTVVVGAAQGRTGDGQAASQAWFPQAADTLTLADGTVLIAESLGFVRRISPARAVSTIAGAVVAPVAYSGEGGLATAAALPGPYRLARDTAGNVYVACSDGTVREILASDGTIRTILGDGTPWSTTPPVGPLAATSMPVSFVRQMSVAPDGSLWVVDGSQPTASPDRIVRVASGIATQVTGGVVPALSGASALGQPVGALGSVDAAGIAPDGSLVAVDWSGVLYRSSDRATITAVSTSHGNGWDHILFDPAGNLVLANARAVRYHSDGSSDELQWPYPGGTPQATAWSISATRVTFVESSGALYQRTLPAVVRRPAAPTGSIVPLPNGDELALRVTTPANPGVSVRLYRGGLLPAGTALEYTDLYSSTPGYYGVSQAWGLGAQYGDTISVEANAIDNARGVSSPAARWSTVFRAPMACVVTPAARVVAYGTRLTVATRTAHYDGRAFGATSGAWKVAPGGLAMTSIPVVTSATGDTTQAIQVLRTTKVAFVVPASTSTTGCSTTVAYSVRGVDKLASSASVARRSTYVTMTATQAPRIAGQPLTLQRLSGSTWVTVAKGLTTAAGSVRWSVRQPSTAGYSSYRVVSATTAALLAATSPTIRVRVI
jgi:hypothetical protein